MKKYLALFIICLFFPILTHAYEDPGPVVKMFSKKKHLVQEFEAYSGDFHFGVNAVSADFDGDRKSEIITAPQAGGGPQIKFFNWKGRQTRPAIFVFNEDYRGGVNLAAGDVNNDGKKELIVSKASGDQAWVKVYSFTKNKSTVLAEFLAFPESFKGGCYVASGNIDKNKKDEIIVGAGAGGGPMVRIFDGEGNWKNEQWYAFDQSFKGGVTVATGNLNKNKKAEIIVGQASQGQAWVKVYSGRKNRNIISEFKAYPDNFEGGVTVSTGKVKKKKKRRIITGPGSEWGPEVKVFTKKGKQKKDFAVEDTDFRGKVNASYLGTRKLFMITLQPDKRKIEGPKVALTFDDCYSNGGSLNKILSTLAQHDLYITFFCLGDLVEKRPAEFQAIVNGGHEIGNHSYMHPAFTTLSEAQITFEIRKTEELMAAFGVDPKPLFRYPGGSHNAQTNHILHTLGYQWYHWTASTEDTGVNRNNRQGVINGALANLHDGGNILAHTMSNTTADALDEIINRIEAAGYAIVKVSELED